MNSPKHRSRILAAIAYAPPPPPGMGYAYDTANPSTPFRPHLTVYRDPETGAAVICPNPDSPPPYDPEGLPPHYRPDPAYLPPLVPIPLQPVPASRHSARYDEDRTGAWIATPHNPDAASYHRRTRPGFEFTTRQGVLYARCRNPEPGAVPVPGLDYRDLPSASPAPAPAERDIPERGTAHIYPVRDTPAAALRAVTTSQTYDLSRGPHARYGVLPLPHLSDPTVHKFLHRYGQAVTVCEADADEAVRYPLPETWTNLPLTVLPTTTTV